VRAGENRASAVLVKPPVERVPAGARRCRATGSRVADDAAGRSCPVVHRPVVPHVLRPGLRFPRADREADSTRHAGRGKPVAAVAHRFFSRARWRVDDLGLAVARLVVALLVPAGQPVTVAIDDTLFKRRGKKARSPAATSVRTRQVIRAAANDLWSPPRRPKFRMEDLQAKTAAEALRVLSG
jgi:hypothetical protein